MDQTKDLVYRRCKDCHKAEDPYVWGAPTTRLASTKVRCERPFAFSMTCSYAEGNCMPITTVPAWESILAFSRACLIKFTIHFSAASASMFSLPAATDHTRDEALSSLGSTSLVSTIPDGAVKMPMNANRGGAEPTSKHAQVYALVDPAVGLKNE